MTLTELINKIKLSTEYHHYDIPDMYKENIKVIQAEREIGERIIEKIGFDVIHQRFFVYENILHYYSYKNQSELDKHYFNTYKQYFTYLNGEVYKNAVYYQINPQLLPKTFDKTKLNNQLYFISTTINDYKFEPNEIDLNKYKEFEQNKLNIINFKNDFINYDTDKFDSIRAFEKIDIEYLLWSYVHYNKNNLDKISNVIKYSANGNCSYWFVYSLCYLFNIEYIMSQYIYDGSGCAESTFNTRKREFKSFIKKLKENSEICKEYFDTEKRFNIRSHLYFVQNKYGIRYYFENFQDFCNYLNNDLSDCDLSHDLSLITTDLSKYKINENTKLPINNNLNYNIIIRYNEIYKIFQIKQIWTNNNYNEIKSYYHEFDFFFDFIKFLNYDLSNIDLSNCNGLLNLIDISNLKLNNTILTSDFYNKFNINYEKYNLLIINEFNQSIQNEENTSLILNNTDRSIEFIPKNEFDLFKRDNDSSHIYYVTDLHIIQKLSKANCKNLGDIYKVIHKITSKIAEEFAGRILLIGGDISSDIKIFDLFFKILRIEINKVKLYSTPFIIVTLGNHEFWDKSLNNLSIDEIINKYKNILNKYSNIMLLQNNIIYYDDRGFKEISTKNIYNYSISELRELLKTA